MMTIAYKEKNICHRKDAYDKPRGKWLGLDIKNTIN
jgi:hypothetical protein